MQETVIRDYLTVEVQPGNLLQIVAKSGLVEVQVRFHPIPNLSQVTPATFSDIEAVVLNADQLAQLTQFSAKHVIKECKHQSEALLLVPENAEPMEIPISGQLKPKCTRSKKQWFKNNNNGSLANFEGNSIKWTKENDGKTNNGKMSLNQVYWIIFHTHVMNQRIAGNPERKWIWTSSNWFKCIGHSSQMCEAVGSYLWLKALEYRNPTVENEQIPQSIEWKRLQSALDQLWLESTGRSLSMDEWNFLKLKLKCTNSKSSCDEYSVTWHDFYVQPMESLDFSFWTWLFNVMQFTKNNFCGSNDQNGLWQQGFIAGFISRDEAFSNLSKNGVLGTFTIRFSETVKEGAVSVCFSMMDKSENFSTFCLHPLDEVDLKARSLIERILDLEVLTHIYPNQPINEDVKRCCQKTIYKRSKSVNPYKPTSLRSYLIFK